MDSKYSVTYVKGSQPFKSSFSGNSSCVQKRTVETMTIKREAPSPVVTKTKKIKLVERKTSRKSLLEQRRSLPVYNVQERFVIFIV